jgi:hypothetical protein
MNETPDILNIIDSWPAPPLVNVETQMSTDQGCRFIVAWKQTGVISNAFNDDCYWRIELLLEKMGHGEFELGESDRVHIEDYVPEVGHVYAAEFEISGRKIPAGVYRPVVVINFRLPDGLPGPEDSYMPVAGFGEFPPIQFYED